MTGALFSREALKKKERLFSSQPDLDLSGADRTKFVPENSYTPATAIRNDNFHNIIMAISYRILQAERAESPTNKTDCELCAHYTHQKQKYL